MTMSSVPDGSSARSLGPARLPVARFGVAGVVRPGDKLVISPAGREVRVRGIQIHGKPANEARAGTQIRQLAQMSAALGPESIARMRQPEAEQRAMAMVQLYSAANAVRSTRSNSVSLSWSLI